MFNFQKVIAIDSISDDLTFRVYRYRMRNLYTDLEKEGTIIEYCPTGQSLENTLNTSGDWPVYFLTGSGHGNPDTYFQSGDTNLFCRTNLSSVPSLNGSIVKLLSCECAQDLGRILVEEKGVVVFIGYNRIFWANLNILDDLLEFDLVIDRMVLNGLPPKEIYRKVQEKYNQAISNLKNKILEIYKQILEGSDRTNFNFDLLAETIRKIEDLKSNRDGLCIIFRNKKGEVEELNSETLKEIS